MELEWMTPQQAAEQWNISDRRVQELCAKNRIKGAIRLSRGWLIPKNTPKPADGRTRKTKQAKAQKRVIDGYEAESTLKVFDEKITIQHLKTTTLFESAMKAKEDALLNYGTVKGPNIKDGRLVLEATIKKGETIPGTGGGFDYCGREPSRRQRFIAGNACQFQSSLCT